MAVFGQSLLHNLFRGDIILKIFVKVMESGIVFTMVNSILFAYFRTKEENKKRITVIIAIVLGLLTAVLSTFIREIPNFVNRTNLSYYSMLPIVTALIGLLVMIPIRDKISLKNPALFENVFMVFVIIYTAASFGYYLPPIMLQLNKFVYYGETALSTMVLFRIIGYTLGILVMILSAVGIYNTASKLSAKELEIVVFTGIAIFGVSQVFVIIQRLYSVKLLPKSDILFSIIAWVANNTLIINFVVMVFFAFLPILLFSKNVKISESYDNRAQLRKIKYLMMRKRHLSIFFMAMITINILSLSTVKSFANRDIKLSAPEDYIMENEHIIVSLSDLEDGHLHRYSYKASDGIDMRFFLIKKSEGAYGVVLDACEICGPSGYFERGNDVVCKLCDVVMNRGTIGFKGGCNPIPIPYIVHDEKIKIDTKDLDAQSSVFK